jgi:predicted secreted Zn-dependent protease
MTKRQGLGAGKRWTPTALFFLCLAATSAFAQSISWRTNYYNVTGSNFQQIRHSIEKSRPWKDNYDGLTAWKLSWTFSMTPDQNGCHCDGFSTALVITTTLPRWVLGTTNYAPRTRELWMSYIQRLADHEHGHGRIALDAAAAVRTRINEVAPGPDCPTLKMRLNELAHATVSEYKERENEYDRRTKHGAILDGTELGTQGGSKTTR